MKKPSFLLRKTCFLSFYLLCVSPNDYLSYSWSSEHFVNEHIETWGEGLYTLGKLDYTFYLVHKDNVSMFGDIVEVCDISATVVEDPNEALDFIVNQNSAYVPEPLDSELERLRQDSFELKCLKDAGVESLPVYEKALAIQYENRIHDL